MFRDRNPFDGKSNFPDFDVALGLALESLQNSSGSSGGNNTTVDQSICSASSMMNLSIGARAALNDHLRHVAKHGLEDSMFSARAEEAASEVLSINNSNNNNTSYIRDPRDALWDCLLDTSNVSNNHSLNTSLHVVSAETLACHDRVVALSNEASGEYQEEVEVLPADQSSDFFNSSRVEKLMTPDRLRDRKINAVTARGAEDESFVSYDPGETSFSLPPHMQPFFQQAPRMDLSNNPNFSMASEAAASAIDNSFSLSAVDISRISADGSEDFGAKQRSPDSSFVFPDHRNTIDELSPYIFPEGNPSSPVRKPPTPKRRFRGGGGGEAGSKSSSSSSFRRSPPASRTNRANKSYYSPKRSSPPIDENMPNFEDAISPIRSQASAAATGALTAPPRYYRRTQSLVETSKLLFAESQHQRPFSLPPRQDEHNSSNTSSSSRQHKVPSMILEYPGRSQQDHSDISTLQNSSSEHNSSGNSAHQHHQQQPLDRNPSSSDSWIPRKKSPLLEDRRRFRTVVPLRVFLTNEPDEFPEQYDSFSAPLPRERRRQGGDVLDASSVYSAPRRLEKVNPRPVYQARLERDSRSVYSALV